MQLFFVRMQSLDTQEVINTFLRIDEVSPPITDEDFLKGELSLIKEKKPVTATQDETKFVNLEISYLAV
jgi:hypothetical protein